MRKIYTIVMGLFIFNAFLSLFGPIFSTSLSTAGVDASDLEEYKLTSPGGLMRAVFIGNLDSWGALVGGLAAAIVLIGGVALAITTRNYVYIGVSLFVSIVVGLYVQLSAVFSQIGTDVFGNNYYVLGIIAIVGIAIGLLVVFNIVDMFAPSPTR